LGKALQTRWLDEAEFARLRGPWQRLLASSDADPLFMSWDWQWLWWQHHHAMLGARLRLLALYAEDDLVALAPMYEHKARLRGIPIRRLEIIGLAWHHSEAFFSEYLDFIVDRGIAAAATECLGKAIEGLRWDELVIGNVQADSLAIAVLRKCAAAAAARPEEALASYRISLASGFETFTNSLSSSARRRLLHHRERLVNPSLVRMTQAQVGATLEHLAELKKVRWRDRYAQSPVLRAFERAVAQSFASRGQLQLTALRSDGQVLGIMYNIRVGTTEYYLQSAFDPTLARGLTPGYLHFGYVMEAAAAEGVTCFDLLAGQGLVGDYKRQLSADVVPVQTYRAVRPVWLRALYEARRRWRASRER
jgi:CelD/BcsL family acetyltransferase involved in cellulose biosynthesis